MKRHDWTAEVYRDKYEIYLTTLEDEPVTIEAFNRAVALLEPLLMAMPEDAERPYLCDAYDGGIDIVWKDRHRSIIVNVPHPGEAITAAACGGDRAERKEIDDGVVDADLLRWIANDINDMPRWTQEELDRAKIEGAKLAEGIVWT